MGNTFSGQRGDWAILWTCDGLLNAAKATGAFIQINELGFIETDVNHGYPIRCVKE